MFNVTQYIESGIIEMYVLGLTNAPETDELNTLIKKYPEIEIEIEAITNALKSYSLEDYAIPNSSLKAMVLAGIDYNERLKNGEKQTFPPILNAPSKLEDNNEGLTTEDMLVAEDMDEIEAKLIGYTPQRITALVWIKDATPPEVHTKEFEKFLIVEGTCDITIDTKIYSLVPGDYLSIPLHVSHFVKVTSNVPCKVILEREAA